MRCGIVVLIVCIALCACGSSREGRGAEHTGQTISTLQYKPGSHGAGVIDRIERFRAMRREEFATFMKAFAASHGDVKHPELARLRQRIAGWFALSNSDYALLPVYLKSLRLG